MTDKKPVTFFANEKLVNKFEEKCNSLDMTKSYALRKLMSAFIKDDSIIVSTHKDLAQEFKAQSNKILEQHKKELSEMQSELSSILENARSEISYQKQEHTKNLVDRIYETIVADSAIQKDTYTKVEQAIFDHYPELRTAIIESKKAGGDVVGDAINICRSKELCSYNKNSKKLHWW